MSDAKMKEAPIADELIPDRAYDLIDRLAEIYPPRCILPHESPETAHRYAGAVELVDQLLDWKDRELGIENPLARRAYGQQSNQMELPMRGMDD